MKNWILLIPLILLEIGSILNAQSTIRGVVKDSLANPIQSNPIPYLQVLLNLDGKVVNMVFTNDLGCKFISLFVSYYREVANN